MQSRTIHAISSERCISLGSQNSWLQATFFCPFASKTLEDLLLPPPPKKDPNKLVVFITSNCGSGGAARRLAYVQELMKYIPVDSYGACLHNKVPWTLTLFSKLDFRI